MKIEKVTFSGIRDIYEYYANNVYREPSAKVIKETTSQDTFSNIAHIYITMSDITPMDAFMLKRYLGPNAIIGDMRLMMLDEFGGRYIGDNEDMKGLEKIYNRAMSIGNQLLEDEDSPNSSVTLLQFPLMYMTTAIVDINGMAIYSLFQQTSFFDIFQNWLNGDQANFRPSGDNEATLDHKVEAIGFYTNPQNGMVIYRFPPAAEVFDSEISPNKPKVSFEDYTIRAFLNSFYYFFHRRMTNVDLVADSLLYNKYLTKPQSYNDIITPYASIDMTGDDRFAEKLVEITSALETNSTFSTNFNDITKYTITVKSSFSTFLRLWMQFPTDLDPNNMIIAWEDLKIVMEKDEYVDSNKLTKFRQRVGNSIQMINDVRNAIDKNKPLIKFNVIPFGVPITYVISGTMREMRRLSEHLMDISQNRYYETFFNVKSKTAEPIFNPDDPDSEFLKPQSLSGNQLVSLATYSDSFGAIVAKTLVKK